MFTPNVQHIVDDIRKEFPTVRVGYWLCRRIEGTLTWSQHAYTQENYLDPDFEGNAADIFPFNNATGDRVAAFLRTEYPEVMKVVLWRVKNHFDHVHFDTWPTGINLPPCRGGHLQVRHKDGRIGREFTYDFDNTPPPEPPPVPVPPQPKGDPMLGLNIGKKGQPPVKSLEAETLQVMLKARGFPNLEVNGEAGDATRSAFHQWKVANGITPELSGGEGVLGANEYAKLNPPT